MERTTREMIRELPETHPVRMQYEHMLRGAAESIGHAPSEALETLLAENVSCSIIFSKSLGADDRVAGAAFASFVQAVRDYSDAMERGAKRAETTPITTDEIAAVRDALAGDVRLPWRLN